eukprot:3824670-Prymnesium_polylepis.1
MLPLGGGRRVATQSVVQILGQHVVGLQHQEGKIVQRECVRPDRAPQHVAHLFLGPGVFVEDEQVLDGDEPVTICWRRQPNRRIRC